MNPKRITVYALIAGTMLGSLVTTAIGAVTHDAPGATWDGPVCRSVSEDSTIRGCDFSAGGWYLSR